MTQNPTELFLDNITFLGQYYLHIIELTLVLLDTCMPLIFDVALIAKNRFTRQICLLFYCIIWEFITKWEKWSFFPTAIDKQDDDDNKILQMMWMPVLRTLSLQKTSLYRKHLKHSNSPVRRRFLADDKKAL